MVKIRKGQHETTVSMGSYENIFKPLGYEIVEEKKKSFYKDEMPKIKADIETTRRKRKQEEE